MKKLFLFLITAFMATNLWADCPLNYVDTIPAQRYITNMSLKINDNSSGFDILSFEDTWRSDLSVDRVYHVYFQGRHTNDLNNGCKWFYVTPETDPGNTMHWYKYEYFGESTGSTSFVFNESNGGKIEKDIAGSISRFVETGIKEIIIVVNPQYKETIVNEVTGETKTQYVSIYGENGIRYKLYNINYLTYSIPSIYRNNLMIENNEVNYGQQFILKSHIQAINAVNYKLQESANMVSWQTIQSGSISTADVRMGKDIEYKRVFVGNGVAPIIYYRLIAQDVTTAEADTSHIRQAEFRYACNANGNQTYYQAGEKFSLPKPADCRSYKIISELPVTQKTNGEYIEFTMPACNIQIEEVTPTYTVKFLNADYSVLKTEEVACGDDATAPADPTYSNFSFIGWNGDFTNVHRNLSVIAKYDVGEAGNNYWIYALLDEHENNVFPVDENNVFMTDPMSKSMTRVMVGDKLTFAVSVFATVNAKVGYEVGQWLSASETWQWNTYYLPDYTRPNNYELFLSQPIQVCYDANTSYVHPFENRLAFRSYIVLAGEKLYSEPFEFDIYYPLTINSTDGSALVIENNAGDYAFASDVLFPARYNDTIRLYGQGDGGCLNYARVLYPSRPLDSGLDEEGNAYIICPGETETVKVSTSQKLVVFDGVYGNGYPKQLDFTAEGFPKVNGYYGEVVPCGGRVTMPEDPAVEGAIFLGWKSWDSSSYPDDAYLHVPATGDNVIGFTAEFEDLPEVPQYTVRFYGKDGSPLLDTQTINEGENAVPPTAPEVSGFHFTGWDKPYTTITEDRDITALYGQDGKTWTVTYKNWDGSDLGTEEVNDGEAAQGVVATRENYTFTGWVDNTTGDAADLSRVTVDMTVKATFTETLYTVTFRVEGVVTHTIQVVAGFDANSIYYPHGTPTKESTAEKVYTFTGWTPQMGIVTEDITFDAVFNESARQYAVRFQNWDHSEIETQKVEYGKSAHAPAAPTREGYTFKGWDREFSNIIADMTVTALFEKNKEQGQAEGVDNLTAPATTTRKVLLDGTLYILHNDQIYNAQGKKLK